MPSETTLAFGMPEARAAATAGGDPLDRIAVRDYTRAIEIGAFQAERGVTQSVRFNVVLEVVRHSAAATDDVDQVLSYDTIVEAIEVILTRERINLLETLAERIAERVLKARQAVRVFIRIEKLDRIPGALGVEIVRSRRVGTNLTEINRRQGAVAAPGDTMHPLVVFLPNAVLNSTDLSAWLDAVAGHDRPAILCMEPVESALNHTGVAPVDRRLGLLAIEQNAWRLAARDSRCMVVDSRTEIRWAIRNSRLGVWAPSRIVLDAINRPDAGADDPLGLARWFARAFSAGQVAVPGAYPGVVCGAGLRVVRIPGDI
ncbi:MAG: dihydroneopterin aldolase [Rhodobacteraceae bacterium]|nr:dihydroneopterin aldolase [Paracoccaceae bacterium]